MTEPTKNPESDKQPDLPPPFEYLMNRGTSRMPGIIFPYEAASEHWDVDFGNPKEVYEGSDLPLWILAGWAVFIIWAVIYLIVGLRAGF